DFFEELFFDDDFFDDDFFDDDFLLPPFFDDDFFDGTLPPSRRASDNPMAMACLRLVTFLPELPLFSVPRFRSCMAFSTLSCAFFPYFAAIAILLAQADVQEVGLSDRRTTSARARTRCAASRRLRSRAGRDTNPAACALPARNGRRACAASAARPDAGSCACWRRSRPCLRPLSPARPRASA